VPNSVRDGDEAARILDTLDGLMLTGDQSNVAAERYGEKQLPSAARLDPARDLTVLSLIPRALAMGIPLLAICRGLQELNVSLGGDLHQDLKSAGSFIKHDEDGTLPRDIQYLPRHELHVTGRTLRDIVGKDVIYVNSLHTQGVRALAPTLKVEASAPDGLVEAVSVRGAIAFALGVQWHPEWHVRSDEMSHAIFRAFGTECRKRMAERPAFSEATERLPRYLKVR
jgi:putative glutamine amidotransferase